MPLLSADRRKEAAATNSQSDRRMGSTCEECSAGEHWIEVELVGEDGKGISGAEYLVVTADGREHSGATDGKGVGRLQNILAGQCRISFPQLDKDAWRAA